MMGRVLQWGIVWGCVFGIHPTAFSEDVPNPEWIGLSNQQNTTNTFFVRKEFSLAQEVRTARLLGAADFNRCVITLNNKRVGEISNYGLPVRKDVSRWLNEGPNCIALECQSSEGPSAVAVRIEIEYRDGTTQTILSNASWQTSKNPEPGWKKVGFQSNNSKAWNPAKSSGVIDSKMLPHPEVDTAINALDDYTQWKQALGTGEGTAPSTFSVPEGFQLERIHSAKPNEGSWVSLEFDEKGRVIIGREDRGLLRVTLPTTNQELKVETINNTLLECRGLLSAHNSLYVSANNSKALYRLRDTNQDDQYDEITKLYEAGGGVGHGRNDLALGPDGKIYLITGDSVTLPRTLTDRTSPFREHSQGRKTNEGHVLRFDKHGTNGELVAAGLRNPYGIAFHPSGELFTYDADAEYDMGSPWYRPTRIVHITPGSDYGWRGVTKSWPPYYPDHADNAPAVLDIGKGSPTGVKFGTKSSFPKPFQDSLFVLDWAYGRILAVQLTPQGSRFVGRAKPFLKGQPFNVTDLDFGPDGAMYVVTGGRKTQSALYRVKSIGPKLSNPAPTPQQIAREKHAAKARKLRHQLESLLTNQASNAIELAWPHLNSEDPGIRYAARTVVEHQPVQTWEQKAYAETRPTAALTALTALVRAPGEKRGRKIRLHALSRSVEKDSLTQQQLLLNLLHLCLENDPVVSLVESDTIAKILLKNFPSESSQVNITTLRVLAQLNAQVNAAEFVPAVLNWLPTVEQQSHRLHGLFVLRNAKAGWTPKLREDYFKALITMREFQGGEGMPTFIRRIEADALNALDGEMRAKFQTLLARKPIHEPLDLASQKVIQVWKTSDLEKDLTQVGKGHDYERGKKLFRKALCIRCHRVGFEGAAVGPDLTSVGRRFSRRDLLESIINPSKVVAEQYRLAKIITTDGRTLSGQILPSRDYRSPKLQLALKPLEPHLVTEISKSEIEARTISKTSVMPKDLLNHLTKAEILELLAWLEAGGNAKHPNYR